MLPYKPDPKLIPRFNIDYNLLDFINSIINLKSDIDITIIQDLFVNKDLFFTNSGRSSLFTILKSLDLPDHSNIGVSLYTCPSVFESIVQAGYNPYFIDINYPDLTLSIEDLNKKISSLDALIVTHAFGKPADMSNIIKISKNIPIIEDCAHALLSEFDGRILGTLGCASFFSFRTGKYLSAGEGGLIVVNNPALSSKIKTNLNLLEFSSTYEAITKTITTFIRSTLYHKPWFGLFSLPFGSIFDNKIDLMNKHSFNKSKIMNTSLYVICKKLKTFSHNVTIQRENSKYLIELMSGLDLHLPLEQENTFYNYYLFPLLFKETNQRDLVENKLRLNGYDSLKLFEKTLSIAKTHYDYGGNCPNTEYIMKRILVIPNYYTLNHSELKRMVEVISHAL